MKITSHTRQMILNAMTKKGLNASQLSKLIGKDRGYISKVLSEKSHIKRLDEDTVDKLNDNLDIILNPVYTGKSKVSPTAIQLSEISEIEPDLAQIMESLSNLMERSDLPFIPYVETKKLPKLGAKLRAIFQQWDEAHNAKAASETLDFLRNYFMEA